MNLMKFLIKNKKSQTYITVVSIILIIITILLASLTSFFVFRGDIVVNAHDEVSASITKGIEYSSNLETKDISILKIWVIASAILKVSVGIAIVIIAITLLIKVLKNKNPLKKSN